MHRTPFHTCSAVLLMLSLALQKQTCSETLCGRQLEGKRQTQLSWMRLRSMKPQARGSSPGQVTALYQTTSHFWKGKAERNVTKMLKQYRRDLGTVNSLPSGPSQSHSAALAEHKIGLQQKNPQTQEDGSSEVHERQTTESFRLEKTNSTTKLHP